MKLIKSLLCLGIILLVFGCASAPTGPSEPGRPWISEVTCPREVPAGDKAKVVFRYQGDQTPVYAEVTAIKLTGMGRDTDITTAVQYRFENQYEVLLDLGKNPTTWTITFYVVDRKGRFSNEASCYINIR